VQDDLAAHSEMSEKITIKQTASYIGTATHKPARSFPYQPNPRRLREHKFYETKNSKARKNMKYFTQECSQP